MFVQADLDALDAAYKGGAQSITSAQGERVDWRSIDEYLRLRGLMQSDIAAAGSSTRVRTSLVQHDRG